MSNKKLWDIAIKISIHLPPPDSNFGTHIEYEIVISDKNKLKQESRAKFSLKDEFYECYFSVVESCFSVADFINMSDPDALVTISFDGKCVGYAPINKESVQNKVIDWLFTFREAKS
jgi:hypothetical protein